LSKNVQAGKCKIFNISSGIVFSQDQEIQSLSITGFPVFTPESSIRCAEGELLFFLGQPREAVSPPVWHSPEPGKIVFSFLSQGCRFDVVVSSTEIVYASNSVSAGVFDCTVTNTAQKETQPVFWSAWRHAPTRKNHPKPFGFSLTNQPYIFPSLKEHADPWNPKQTWFLENNSLIRGNQKVYWLSSAGGWSVDVQVREQDSTYHSLDRSQLLGWLQLTAHIKPKQKKTFQLIVPYFPIDYS